MPPSADLLTTREVSDLLGVEARQVRNLAEAGSIERVARGVFDRQSVERFRAHRGSGRTRTWAEHTAWAAIAMLSGVSPLNSTSPVGIGDTQRYRLTRSLTGITDTAELTLRLRERAEVTTWSGHRSVVQRVRGDLVVPGRRRLGLVENESIVDGYVHHDRFDGLVSRYNLMRDARGSITLRRTTMEIGLIESMVKMSRTLAAVDAATSLDPRESGVGHEVLAGSLALFRENGRR